uniref:Perlucin-like protein isoform A n=1 Tax=Ruditapes philippinarum TaxID=129788 RepID=C8CBM7_RUDPH|nr:perlucin-like protein isoform A [Ruditapes philippinarum]
MKASIIWFIMIASHVKVISAGAYCDDGWIAYSSHCYYIGFVERSFMEAHNFCDSRGAYLVRIESSGENSFLTNLLRNLRVSDTWTGLSDMRSEGSYRWFHSNNYPSYTNWGRGEPNNDGNEDCVGFWSRINYYWNDFQCRHELRPLCEKS